MNVDVSMEAKITKWVIADEGWLRVDVLVAPLGVRESFYRVDEDASDVWVWRKWSAAGKPTVRVAAEASAMLNRLLFDHPVLSRILDQFGYSDRPTTPQVEPDCAEGCTKHATCVVPDGSTTAVSS